VPADSEPIRLGSSIRCLAALTVAACTATAVLSACGASGSTRDATVIPGQRQVHPYATQWFHGAWQQKGRYRILASSISRQLLDGEPTYTPYLYQISSNGDLFGIHLSIGGVTHAYLDTYNQWGTLLRTHALAIEDPLQCAPRILQVSPLVVRCVAGASPYLYVDGAGRRLTMPGSVRDFYYLKSIGKALEVLVIPPVTRMTRELHFHEVEISPVGTIRSISSFSIDVDADAGGGVTFMNSGPGWIVLSNRWDGSSTGCTRAADYTSAFQRRWVRTVGSPCFGVNDVGPQVVDGHIFFALAGETTIRAFELSLLSGKVDRVAVLMTGAQSGLVVPPVIAVDDSDHMWIAGIGDGILVGEQEPNLDYVYMVELDLTHDQVVWKARMDAVLTDQHVRASLLYVPTEVASIGNVDQLVAPVEQGTSGDLPLALMMSVHT
jgi:hypothetical protein